MGGQFDRNFILSAHFLALPQVPHLAFSIRDAEVLPGIGERLRLIGQIEDRDVVAVMLRGGGHPDGGVGLVDEYMIVFRRLIDGEDLGIGQHRLGVRVHLQQIGADEEGAARDLRRRLQ